MFRSLFALFAAGVVCASPVRADDFFFKDGDRVIVLGDSITEQHLYSNYLEMWTVTRFPTWHITFRNVGIGGDRSTGGNSRFKRDIASYKPTAMTVDFGMNDGNYQEFKEPGYKTYMNGLQGIATQAKAANIRVAWVTPSPVEKTEDGAAIQGYNETLEKYSAGVKEIAEKNGGLFVDQFHPFIAALDKARAADPRKRIGGGDAVHPGAPGQALMAAEILKGLHFPSLVASVEIDAAGNKVTAAKNCTAEGLEASKDHVKFQEQDAALPFFPPAARSILAWSPLEEQLNDYRLKVTGLAAGKYTVSLGGTAVADYSAEQLAEGVNLAAPALSKGPIAEQVKQVEAAVEAKNKHYHDRIFRGIVLAGGVPDWLNMSAEEIRTRKRAAMEQRERKIPELEAAIQKALTPRPHTVEIAPVK
ncbi:SGNH/GDSL hydrolase family protein [soil metagenome]